VFAGALGRLGIGEDAFVVAYDDAGGAVAVRLWWMLRGVGQRAAVLDGGLAAWTALREAGTSAAGTSRDDTGAADDAGEDGSRDGTAGTTSFGPGELETGPGVERPTVARTPVPWPATLVATADEVAAVSEGRVDRVRLLDARAPERYRGEVEPIDPRPGHIPGAVNAPVGDNLDPETRRFRPADELRVRYAGLLGEPPNDVIAYCGSGVNACHTLLALEVAGLPGGKLVAGSWSEWSARADRPAATGPEPE
jgi:thiosulfate/3-mercaptopyruvate sulfurtransferase